MFQIETFVKGFKLSSLTYKRVMHLLNEEMNSGLHANYNYMADIKMFPTFVRSLPDGSGKMSKTCRAIGSKPGLPYLPSSRFKSERTSLLASKSKVTEKHNNLGKEIWFCQMYLRVAK